MSMKYVRCSHCGKKVYFGDFVTVSEDEDSSDVYCSSTCYVQSYGGRFMLTEDQANYFNFKVYDDSKRKREIEEQMAKLQRELELLNAQQGR